MSNIIQDPGNQPPEEKEKVFTFDKYNADGSILETVDIKESELTEEHCFLLAKGLYASFLNMPVTAQDFFIRRVINEAMEDQKQAIETRTPGRIITLDKSN